MTDLRHWMTLTSPLMESNSGWQLISIDQLPQGTKDDICSEIAEHQPDVFDSDPTYVRDNLFGLADPPKVWLGRMPVADLTRSMKRDNSTKTVGKYRDMLRDGLQDFDPILTARGRFLDGGHRLQAYAQAGRPTIPVVDIGHLVDAPRKLWQAWTDGEPVSFDPGIAPAPASSA